MTCQECGMKQCVCEYDPLLEDEEASDFINLTPKPKKTDNAAD